MITYRKLIALEPALNSLYASQRGYFLAKALQPSMLECLIALETFKQKRNQLLAKYGDPSATGAKQFPQGEKQKIYNAEIDLIADAELETEFKPLPWWVLWASNLSAKEIEVMESIGLIANGNRR